MLVYEEFQPTRVDLVDNDSITFLFVRGRAQGTVDCYTNGEIVFGYSSAIEEGVTVKGIPCWSFNDALTHTRELKEKLK